MSVPHTRLHANPAAARTPLKAAVVGCGLLMLGYVATLIYVDQTHGVFRQLPQVLSILPLIAALSFLSYIVRYVRWRWLLLGGHSIGVPWLRGLLAYLAGFALTASPGKVGELLRIRYYAQMGIRAERVIACFVAERLLDLVVLLALALPLARSIPGFGAGIGLVTIGFGVVVAAVLMPRLRYYPIRWLRALGLRSPAVMVRALARGVADIRGFITPSAVAGGFGLGVISWVLQAAGLVIVMNFLGIGQSLSAALPIMPAAMLLGAASMLPGGVGTTEAAIVAILSLSGVPTSTAILAAVGARLGSLWFAMVVGIAACVALDLADRYRVAASPRLGH